MRKDEIEQRPRRKKSKSHNKSQRTLFPHTEEKIYSSKTLARRQRSRKKTNRRRRAVEEGWW